MSTVLKLQVTYKEENFLTSCVTISFSRRTLLHGFGIILGAVVWVSKSHSCSYKRSVNFSNTFMSHAVNGGWGTQTPFFSLLYEFMAQNHSNVGLLLLKRLYSPMRTFASLMDFSQSSLYNRSDCSEATSWFPNSGVVSSAPRPTPNLEDQVSIFISPGEWVAQLYPLAPSTHFSRFYDMHELHWDYSFPRSPHAETLDFNNTNSSNLS
jgi:hypothetical protein